ncbi:MAG: hypothetical protein V3T31_05695 [candidate division Zixibacteria bacterium]
MQRNFNIPGELAALGFALLLLIMFAGQSFAEGKISAYHFGDYAYIAKSNDANFDF